MEQPPPHYLVGELVALDLAKRGRLGELAAYKAANPASKLTWQIAATHLFPHFPLVAKLGLPGFYNDMYAWYMTQYNFGRKENDLYTWRELEHTDEAAEVRGCGFRFSKFFHFKSEEAKWKHWVGWVYAAHIAWAQLEAEKYRGVTIISCTQCAIVGDGGIVYELFLPAEVFSDVKNETFLRSEQVRFIIRHGHKYAKIYEAIFIQLNGLPHKEPLNLLEIFHFPKIPGDPYRLACRVCGDDAVLKQCGQCRIAVYCGAQCQHKDWDAHSVHCKK
jgi:hypothetical protein